MIRSSLFIDVSKDLRWPIVAHSDLRTSASEAVAVCALMRLDWPGDIYQTQIPIRLSKQHAEVPSVAISTLGQTYNVPSKKLRHLSQFVSRIGEVTNLAHLNQKSQLLTTQAQQHVFMRSRQDDYKLCFAHMCTERLIDVDLFKASSTYVNAAFWDVKAN